MNRIDARDGAVLKQIAEILLGDDPALADALKRTIFAAHQDVLRRRRLQRASPRLVIPNGGQKGVSHGATG